MLRWGGSRRLQEADIHNRLGVWGLPFHVVVSVTGALLGLSSVILGVLALAAYDGDRSKAVAVLFGPTPTNNQTPAPLPDLAAMIARVKTDAPKAEFSYAFVQQIGTAGQVTQIGVHAPGRIAFSETYHFGADGQLISSPNQRGQGAGRWILGALQPLHFGWFAGLPSKLLYGILGLALAVVTHTGVTIWLARRRDKGRPAPGWEKTWAVVGWSQPLAFATTAIAAMTLSAAPLLAVYVATVGACAVLAYASRDSVVLVRTLRLLSGLSFLVAAGMHAFHWRGTTVDEMAVNVDLAFVALAAAILAPSLQRRGEMRKAAAAQK